jgi:hypothetical protein
MRPPGGRLFRVARHPAPLPPAGFGALGIRSWARAGARILLLPEDGCRPPSCFSSPPSVSALMRAAHDLERVTQLCDTRERQLALQELPSAESNPLLIARRGHVSYFRAIEPLELLALERIRGGTRFDNLCAALGPNGANPARIVEYLRRWVEDGVIVEVRREGER